MFKAAKKTQEIEIIIERKNIVKHTHYIEREREIDEKELILRKIAQFFFI